MANTAPLSIRPIDSKADRKKFIALPFRLYKDDPNWVPPLKGEALGLITPEKNGWFSHAKAQLFLAERGGQVVGRISAHIDTLALTMPPAQGFGPGCGQFGLFDAEDENAARALINTAEDWLRGQGMDRVLGPISMSIWEEPGLLIEGYDHPPTIMMGHAKPIYREWIESAGYLPVKQLKTYRLEITGGFPPIVQRIVQSGERNPRIRIRMVDKTKFDEEAAIILAILNDAWSGNWGFVPLTPPEIADVGVKLKPIVFNELIRIAELDGQPVAFMITLPDANQIQMKAVGRNGKPSILGWIKLGLWMLRTKPADMRVPLMGVVKRLQSSRMASQLAFMMIETIRQASVTRYQGKRGEIGWILDDNQGMNAIAEAIDATVNKEYLVYGKGL